MANSEPTQRPRIRPDDTRRDDPYAVLRDRNFALYLLSRFIASLGQQMLSVAVGWEIYERTHSALALGLVGLTQMVPMVIGTLPSGHIADNYNRKRIILVGTIGAALASLGLTVISAFQFHVFFIYLCLLIAGTARTFLWPASAAFMPSLVRREIFSKAVTWNTGMFHLSSVVGPAIGGWMISAAHGAAIVYALNAVSLIVCFALISFVRDQQVVTIKEKMTLGSLIAGFKFVFANRVIIGTISLDMLAVLLGGATALLPVYAKDILHTGPEGLGFLQAAMPIGALVTAAIIAHRPSMKKAGRALLWSVAGFGAATIAFGYSTTFWFAFAMLLICGALDNISVVVRHTLVQILTPDEKRGRVSAVNSLFIGTSNELGGFESGFVAYLFGPVFSVVAGGIGTILVVAAVALIWPEIRKYGRLDPSN